MQPVPSILVFCEVDETVLDPHTYSVDAVGRRALERIARDRIPIVLCSSKTRAELEVIQQELGISHPFICESGAAVFVPQGYFGFTVPEARDAAGYKMVEFGKPYAEVVATLHRAAGRLGIEVLGFSDMSVEDVAADCHLPLLQARLAKLREYSEPFRVVGAKPGATTRLFKALRGAGLECTSRGRYYHAGAIRRDIGAQLLGRLYRCAFGELLVVAFGDHGSAVPLLRQADVPLIVQSGITDETTHLLARVPAARLSVADSVGAWADVILEIADAAQHRGASASTI